MMEQEQKAILGKTAKSYRIISSYANSNIALQGLSGVFGFPVTILADGAVIFTHYTPMIDELRELYGRRPVERDAMTAIVRQISNEILFDLVVDKVMGQVPLAGIYFNVICAKAMTWRLGMLFAILSSRGEEINIEHVKEVMELIRWLSPQTDVFRFRKPEYKVYEKVLDSVYNNPEELFRDKVHEALRAFEI